MTACRYTSCVLADSPASFMSSIIRVRIADIVCSFVIDGTTRLDADDSLTSYSSGDAATPPRLRHRRSRPFNGVSVLVQFHSMMIYDAPAEDLSRDGKQDV